MDRSQNALLLSFAISSVFAASALMPHQAAAKAVMTSAVPVSPLQVGAVAVPLGKVASPEIAASVMSLPVPSLQTGLAPARLSRAEERTTVKSAVAARAIKVLQDGSKSISAAAGIDSPVASREALDSMFELSSHNSPKVRLHPIKAPRDFFPQGPDKGNIPYYFKKGHGEFKREILLGVKKRATDVSMKGALDTNLSAYRSYSTPHEDDDFETLSFDIERKLASQQPDKFSAMIDGVYDPATTRGPTLNQFITRAKKLGFQPRSSHLDGETTAEAMKDGILINWSDYNGKVMIGVIHENPILRFEEVIGKVVPTMVKIFNYLYPGKAISPKLVALSIEVAKRSNKAPLER